MDEDTLSQYLLPPDMAHNVWRNHAAVLRTTQRCGEGRYKELIIVRGRSRTPRVSKTVERPQLLLLTSLQPRLSTKGATWLRLLCAGVEYLVNLPTPQKQGETHPKYIQVHYLLQKPQMRVNDSVLS